MIYKNHKDIYRRVASKFNLDEDIIQTIGDFYYEDIGRHITNFNYREIYLNKLGVIKFRKKRSAEWIKNSQRVEAMIKKSSKTEERIKEILDNMEAKREKMRVLIKQWDDLRDEKIRHRKEIRNAYRDIQE